MVQEKFTSIGPSRRQLLAEIDQLKKANEILSENLRLRQEIKNLRDQLAQYELPRVLTSAQVIEIMQYGNNKGYSFIKDLEKMGCPVVWYGREPRVPRDGFLNWLNTGEGKNV